MLRAATLARICRESLGRTLNVGQGHRRTSSHRVFALTLNLNDDYEGGQLRFPEYGNHLYRPDAGAALVFSCAHLHEVVDVTEGRRFVLLSFLSGGPAGVRCRTDSATRP